MATTKSNDNDNDSNNNHNNSTITIDNQETSEEVDEIFDTCPQCLHWINDPPTRNCKHPWHTWEMEYHKAVFSVFEFISDRRKASMLISTIKKSDPKLWKRRYTSFVYYGTIIINKGVYDETELKNLKDIEKNVNEPWHFRIQAADCAAMILRKKYDVKRLATKLITVLDFCRAAFHENDAESMAYQFNKSKMREFNLPGTVRAVIELSRATAQKTLARLMGTIGDRIENAKINIIYQSPYLATLTCGGCGVARIDKVGEAVTEDEDVNLKLCARCERFAYCSKACQILHWKEGGHKIVCQQVGEFRDDDFVKLFGLVNKKDLNGHFGVIKGVLKRGMVLRDS
ncbi:hypothetical protein HDU76_002639 [Blyttiomyces sp. JEL0837]|nr:hypothetical protein HDU76_002639 [Blyttiomyces sp. JEL0837]